MSKPNDGRVSRALGCVWIPDLARKKEMKMEKLDDATIRDHRIIYHFHFHFHFLHQILDSNTALLSIDHLKQ